jgi:hypothetical protein
VTDKQLAAKLKTARAKFKQTREGYKTHPTGPMWTAALPLLDEVIAELERPALPALGPVQPGGVSLLDMSLTHKTSGIPLFPAIDTAWGGGGGVTVIAPERCTVDTKDTSSSPGEAVYLTGASKLRHWVGHLDRDWPLGHVFKKGAVIGKTLPIPGQSDHAHWGVNAEAFLGAGKQLLYGRDGDGPDYTLGAPTIGAQLARGNV